MRQVTSFMKHNHGSLQIVCHAREWAPHSAKLGMPCTCHQTASGYGQASACTLNQERLTFMATHSAKYCVPYFSAPVPCPMPMAAPCSHFAHCPHFLHCLHFLHFLQGSTAFARAAKPPPPPPPPSGNAAAGLPWPPPADGADARSDARCNSARGGGPPLQRGGVQQVRALTLLLSQTTPYVDASRTV
jgi:hypothetical protein